MSILQDEIATTKSFFHSLNIPLSSEWLESCIKWFKDEKDCEPYTDKELKNAVYGQWLVFDLREVQVSQLPSNVSNITKLVCRKCMVLQMMSIMDISKPKLQQINKIKNSYALTRGFDDESENNQVISKRMLQMILTDGVQEIKAIEYQTIACLNLNLRPGIKIRINPPFTIRRGTILLESQHVNLLGGEVEEIFVTHSAENVLAKSLNLPLNTNAGIISNNTVINENKIELDSVNDWFSNYSNTNNTKMIIEKSDEKKRLSTNERPSLNINKVMKGNSKNDTVKVNQQYFEQSDILEQQKKHLLESKLFNENDSNGKTHTPKPSVDLTMEELSDFFVPWEDEKEEEKIYTLAEIKQLCATKKPGVYTTFAKFRSIVRKLTVNEDGWKLRISIENENDYLTVDVHDQVLTQMGGHSAWDILEKKKRVQQKDVQATEYVMTVLNDLRLKLQNLNCLMEIECKDCDESVPCIVKVL